MGPTRFKTRFQSKILEKEHQPGILKWREAFDGNFLILPIEEGSIDLLYPAAHVLIAPRADVCCLVPTQIFNTWAIYRLVGLSVVVDSAKITIYRLETHTRAPFAPYWAVASWFLKAGSSHAAEAARVRFSPSQ